MKADVEKEVLNLLQELTDLCGIMVKNQRKMLTLQNIIHNEIIDLAYDEYEVEEGEKSGNC